METTLSIQIVAIFLLFAVSLSGICLPFLNDDRAESDVLKFAKAGSAGIMLSLALIHLLGEANEILEEEGVDFPLAYALTVAGVVLVLGIEQLTMAYASKMDSGPKKADTFTTGDFSPTENSLSGTRTITVECKDSRCDEAKFEDDCGLVQCGHHDHTHSHEHEIHVAQPDECVSSDIESAVKKRTPSASAELVGDEMRVKSYNSFSEDRKNVLVAPNTSVDDELNILDTLMKSTTLKDVIVCYIMEFSIAVHSIIIGFDLGLLGSKDQATLVTLTIAIAFHQFIEGIGLGTTISSSRVSLGSRKLMLFVAIFSSTISFGIMGGIIVRQNGEAESHGQLMAKGIANSFAAGSLLYISLTEMVSSYFSAPELVKRPLLRVWMLGSFALGCFSMAILAIWA